MKKVVVLEHCGAQNGVKIGLGSEFGSGADFGLILDRFWDDFGSILDRLWVDLGRFLDGC